MRASVTCAAAPITANVGLQTRALCLIKTDANTHLGRKIAQEALLTTLEGDDVELTVGLRISVAP